MTDRAVEAESAAPTERAEVGESAVAEERPSGPGTALVPRPVRDFHDPGAGDGSSWALVPRAAQLARMIAATEFVKKGLRNRPAATAAAMLLGHELGLGPMTTLQRISITEDGVPIMEAQAMRALVQSRGHRLWFEELSSTRVTAVGQRRDDPDHPQSVTWTMEDARRANLVRPRSGWDRFPRAMLTARATAELCRLQFADVLGGIAYSSEELADGLEGMRDIVEAGAPDVVDANGQPPPAPTTTRQVRRRRDTVEPAAQAAEDTSVGAALSAAETPPEPPPAPAPPAPEAAASGPPEGTWAGLEVPGDPPLGQQPLTETAAVAGTPIKTETVKLVATWARDAGVARDDIVRGVTRGRTTSARELSEEEGQSAIGQLRAVARGEARIEVDEEGFPVVRELSDDLVRNAAIDELGRIVARDRARARTVIVKHGWSADLPAPALWLQSVPRATALALRSEIRAILMTPPPADPPTEETP